MMIKKHDCLKKYKKRKKQTEGEMGNQKNWNEEVKNRIETRGGK